MTIPGATKPRTVTSDVTVGVDPLTAFTVFTDEIDLWWVRGPINFYDSSRATGMRCESGVGGRLLELYSQDASDAMELGRITAWQPGVLLAWDSSVDDVRVEVRFDPVAAGSTVRVTCTIPAGGADRGGTAWVRVTPSWLGAWCARRDTAPRVPAETVRLALALYYAKPLAAGHWLADAFGFEPELELPAADSGDEPSWLELRSGNCAFMVFRLDADRPDEAAPTHVPWVYVDDLEAHLDRARAAGAQIVSGIHQHGYRAYVAKDLEGGTWTFAQARPGM